MSADDDDDFGEDGAFVHALVAQVRAEQPGIEPSELLTARLMAAAKKESRRGGWARIAAHPGVAAAAMLVIVVGATAIWMKTGGKVAEPAERSESAPAAAPAPPPSVPSVGTTPRVEDVPSSSSGSASAASAASGSGATELPPAPIQRGHMREPTAKKEHAESPPPPPVTDKGTTILGGEADATKTAPPPPPPPPKDDRDQQANGPKGTGAATKTAPDSGGLNDQVQTEETVTVEPQQVSGTQLAAQYTEEARSAAKKKQCSVVHMLGDKVKKIDAGYYANNFANDPDIKGCR